LASGEQHPLLNIVAEHSVALLTVIRAVIDDTASPATGTEDPPEPPPEPPSGPGRYQHIPVTVEE
jgi:hypothetical protein